MQVRTFVVVALSSALAGVALGAGDTGAGIADVRSDRTTARRAKTGAPDRERGGALTVLDERPSPVNPSTLPPATFCDFIGFSHGDAVNGAYGGGTSSGGVARTNLGVNFSGASVLNTWNGCCSPDASIAYAPAGSMTMSSSNGAFWRGIEFHYSAIVPVTVETFAGLDAGGGLLQTFSVPANLSTGPYSSWTLRQIQFATVAKSVRLSGTANRWGIDAMKITAGCPAPTSGSDDCNGNGQSDACEIATGLVQDCNGNGKPDSCDIAGTPPVPGAVQWRVADGGNDHWYAVLGEPKTWAEQAGLANALGAHLVTLTSATENAFVHANFPGRAWLGGFADPNQGCSGSSWKWVTGEPWSFATWAPPEPNYCDETHLEFSGPYPTRWNNFYGASPNSAIIEWSAWSGSADCNINGIPDSCEIANGSVADCNSNGIPDSCDIAGGMADCNGNGALDSCELASGAAVDQNGNGVPDSCDPFPTLVLTANAAACNAIGSEVDVEARLSGVLNLVVAGQIVLDWDPTKLELVAANPGDAPFASASIVNNAAGQLVVLTPAAPGGSGTTAPSVVVSRLKFRVLGGSCDGSGTSIGFGSFMGMLETAFTDGVGSSGFVVDDGAPVLSNVPADVSVQAYAGENGFALVTLGTPTATDACAPGLMATGVRSDGQALGAAWPSGTTTVTWSAVDPCGNTTTATTSVTVDPTNTMDLSAQWGSGFAGASRSLTLNLLGGSGNQSRTQVVSIPAGGSAMFSVTDLPVDTYTCATIEDPARSLRARVSVSDSGSNWSAASATMVLGDLINDEVIDVLDWGAYIVLNPNADLNADGSINSGDGNIILANFGRRGDTGCVSSLDGPRDPILAITVADVISMGLPELAGADLNGDGWIDQADMDFVR
jgi:hypothetical protein